LKKNGRDVGKKWQRRWESKKVFRATDNAKRKKKYYVLEMYPYPSGSGLHMGHAFNYTIGDIYARLRRMQGYNVLYPMGYDSFGLPAENAAIEAKSHPKKFTEQAIKNYIKQQKALGLSYDWSRLIMSHDSEFYKWDQWIFLKMYEKDLAYRKKAPVNFCNKCKTVLANEQVINGKCWRHEDTEVEIKFLEQWFLRITDYADTLYREIDSLDGWPEMIKKLQKNWIGRSEGTEVDFRIVGKGTGLKGSTWPVFTTRPDTLFGVTFLVVSANHPELMGLVADSERDKVEKFLRKVKSVKEEDIKRVNKEGVFTGSYAEHPLTGKTVPIWVGNFVVVDYGSGMVMGVPAHDERDFEFARKYNLPIKEVVRPKGGKPLDSKGKEAYTGFGVLGNSEGFNGLKSEEAMQHITNALEMKHKGRKAVAFRLKDWLISRQRFWGTPIPIIYCDDCGIVPVPEKNLPVKLPDNVKFTGVKNPLTSHKAFAKVKCPKCGNSNAHRETDTMDTFANSSWYFLRYTDAKNKKKIFDSKKANYWAPIDLYIGGKEHATLHLIYFRFYTKFLNDLGLLSFDEPALRLFNQGFIYGRDGRKMSKSYGNVVLPDEAAKKYGVDATRMFLVSVAGPDKDLIWSDNGAEGSLRFVMKVIGFVEDFKSRKIKSQKLTKLQESKLNRTIRDYTDDLENFRYNLAVIKLRSLFYVLEEDCDKKALEIFLKLLSPICPHIAEELWEMLRKMDGSKSAHPPSPKKSKVSTKSAKSVRGHNFISLEKWPVFDKKKIDDKLEANYNNVVNAGKDIKKIAKILEIDSIEKAYLYTVPSEFELYKQNEETIKTISGASVIEICPNNEKKLYDPQKKSKKAKPGKPGIYIEPAGTQLSDL